MPDIEQTWNILNNCLAYNSCRKNGSKCICKWSVSKSDTSWASRIHPTLKIESKRNWSSRFDPRIVIGLLVTRSISSASPHPPCPTTPAPDVVETGLCRKVTLAIQQRLNWPAENCSLPWGIEYYRYTTICWEKPRDDYMVYRYPRKWWMFRSTQGLQSKV